MDVSDDRLGMHRGIDLRMHPNRGEKTGFIQRLRCHRELIAVVFPLFGWTIDVQFNSVSVLVGKIERF